MIFSCCTYSSLGVNRGPEYTSTMRDLSLLTPLRSFVQCLQPMDSDNGTSFTSAEFREFLRRNGIQHQTTTPYHPSANGLTERAIQTFKQAMKKYAAESTDVEMHVSHSVYPQLDLWTKMDTRGKITILHGSTNAEVETENGRVLHRHLDQVRKRFVPSTVEDDCLPNPSHTTYDEPMLRRSTTTRHPPDRLQLS